MSNGGAFVLITNDGKIDKLLLASSFLSENLANITEVRRKSGMPDPTPTISDIEKTHIMFFYNSFSPFVSLAFEYMKVTPTGSATPGGSLTFSIPLNGDLFTDTVFKVHVGQVVASRENESTEYLRYCDYVGEKLFRHVSFTVNGNQIDRYDYDIMPVYREFRLLENKRAGWNKMNGQEAMYAAYGDTLSGRGNLREVAQVVNGIQTPKIVQPEFDLYIPMMSWFCGDARDAIPSVSIPYGQRLINIELADTKQFLQYAGISPIYDNPKQYQPPDPMMKIDMYINNIYINPDVHDVLIKQISFNMIRLYQRQYQDLRNAEDRIQFTQFKFPIETIYWSVIPDENRDVNSTKMLKDWWKSERVESITYDECCCPNFLHFSNNQEATVTPQTQIAQITREMLLGQGNFVLANGFDISAKMQELVARGDQGFIELLPPPLGTIQSVKQFYEIMEYVGYAGTLDWDATTFQVGQHLPNIRTTLGTMVAATRCTKTYENPTPVIRNAALESHGVMVYHHNNIEFYNAYLPWRYGCTKIRTPDTVGNGVFWFNLFPPESQPSGYFNFSRARETYFIYGQSEINSSYTAKFVGIGIAINFLLISDGTAIVRFGT